MKKIFLCIFPFFAFNFVIAQNINVNSTLGVNSSSYATLKDAFDAVNAGTHKGIIEFSIVGNTLESATASLQASGYGVASYTSINIKAAGTDTFLIEGNIQGAPLIELNGADNVNFDGQGINGNYLILSNNSTSSLLGTSTIKFVNDAVNNIFTNCKIQGSETVNILGTNNGATIWFSTGNSVGNDNNLISNCDIGSVGNNMPYRAIWSYGTSGVNSAIQNSSNSINNCRIYDYFSPVSISRGIEIYTGNSDWNITNNKFYQTSNRVQTTGALHNAIRIDAGGNYSGNNFLISGNTIGYSSSDGTGYYSISGSTNSFVPIDIASIGTQSPISIQGNTITAINQATNRAGASSGSSLILILISSGAADIGNVSGNILGGNNSITHTCNNIGGADIIAICGLGSGNLNISNNTIGNFSLGSNSNAISFYGIYANTNSSLTNTFSNNIIGLNTPNSISVNANFSSSKIIGIYSLASKSIVANNIIRNLTLSASNSGTSTNASMIGISIIANNAQGHQILANTIHSLHNSEFTSATSVIGIHYNGSNAGTNQVNENFIHSLSVSSNNSSSEIIGINAFAGATNYVNNMIALGYNALGNNLNYGINMSGILDFAGSNNYFFNSIFVGGNIILGGTGSTYAFRSEIINNSRIIKNNIFYNARQNNSNTSANYSIKVSGSGMNPTGLSINNNDYFFGGSGSYFGQYNGFVNGLSAWKNVIGQDANSISVDPLFTNTTGNANAINLHINSGNLVSFLESGAVAIPSITKDIDGNNRPGPNGSTLGGGLAPDMGADEFDGNMPCTGSPIIANVSVGYSPVCIGSITSLNLVGYPTIGGLTFQWKTSNTELGVYSAVQDGIGAQTRSYSTGIINQSVYYLCTITCPYSGISINTTPVSIGIIPNVSSAPNPTIANIYSDSVKLVWNSISNASNYSLDISSNINFTSLVANYNNKLVSDSILTIKGLTAGTQYYVRLKAENSCGATGYSITLPLLTICNPPIINQASATGNNGFTINWNPAFGASSYLLDVSTDSSFTSFVNGYHLLAVSGLNKVLVGLNPSTKYYFKLQSVNASGKSIFSTTNSQTTSGPSLIDLYLTVFLQGLYLGNNQMTAATYNYDNTLSQFVADTILVELHSAINNHDSLYAWRGLLNINGTTTANFPTLVIGNSYFIVIKHRNSIETWSSVPVLFSINTAYNFSLNSQQTYGNNLVNHSGVFLIYSGDINQDGSIDFNDYPSLDIASSNGLLGYDSNDINGDASVDFNDYPIIDQNSSNGIISVKP